MVSTPEGFTNNSPITPMVSTPIKKSRARKLLCIFTNILEVKNKNAYRLVGADKSKHKAIKFGNKPWALKHEWKGNSKID